VKHYYLPAGSGVNPIETIFQNRTMAMGSGTCNWTVPNVKFGGFVNSPPCTSQKQKVSCLGTDSSAFEQCIQSLAQWQ
jgi:hypothetical protein